MGNSFQDQLQTHSYNNKKFQILLITLIAPIIKIILPIFIYFRNWRGYLELLVYFIESIYIFVQHYIIFSTRSFRCHNCKGNTSHLHKSCETFFCVSKVSFQIFCLIFNIYTFFAMNFYYSNILSKRLWIFIH